MQGLPGVKLAFCIFKYFPYGGVSRDLEQIARACAARGHGVRVYALEWQGDVPKGVEAVPVRARGLTGPARYRRFADRVSRHLGEYPVELVVGFNKMPGLDVYVAGDSCYEEKARTQRGWYYRLLPRYRHFAQFERDVFGDDRPVRILTVSDTQKPAFKRHYGTPDERFFPLPPAVEVDRTVPADRAEARAWLRREFDLPEEARVLLFVGSGYVTKGLDRVLRAFAVLPDAVARDTWLLVVGQDRSRPFERLAVRLGLGERVRFVGARDDVPRILQGGDALTLPAYNEAAGLVILEALAAGLPALVTDACGFAPFVSRAEAGIVSGSPFDQGKYNGELAEILTSPRRATWSANGRRLAESGALGGRAHTARDLIERFARGELRPTVALCLHRVAPRGGISRDLLTLAAACRARGWQVRVYTLSWQAPDGVAGVDVVVVPVASMTGHRRIERFERWVAQALRRSPVHCLVGFNKMPGLDICLAAEPCAAREGDRMRTRIYRGTPRFRQVAHSERAVFCGTTTVLARSPRWAEDHVGYYDAAPEVVGPLVEPPPACADGATREEVRRDWGAAEDDCVLLYVENAGKAGEAGLDRLLLTLAALPEAYRERVRLVVLDAGSPLRGMTALKSMAQGLGLGRRVRFEDSGADAVSCYRAADLLVHPAYRDLAGHAVLEAVLSGLPVVTTSDVGCSEHVAAAEAGVVVDAPFELDTFKRAVIEALDDERRRAWAGNARRYASATKFGGLARVLELIEGCVRQRGQTLSAR